MDFVTKIWIWIKGNIFLSLLILFCVILLFFPKLLKGLIGKPRRIKHGANWYITKGRPLPDRLKTKSGKSLPRSVGTKKRKQYTKGGKLKKPWQIKGSEAARRHMAKIRRMR